MIPTARIGLPRRIVARIRRDVPLALLDGVIVVPAYPIPLSLRFHGTVPSKDWRIFWLLLPAIALIHLLSNYLFGLYGQMWRYASVQEARRVLLSGVMSFGLVLGLILFLNHGDRPIPLSVIAFGSASAVMAFGAVRFQSRLFAFRRRSMNAHRMRVLLMGAGDAGAQVLRDILRDSEQDLQVVGLIDDDPRDLGRAIHGVDVLGGRAAIPALGRRLNVDQVLLAIPSATGELIREVATLCEEGGDVASRAPLGSRDRGGARERSGLPRPADRRPAGAPAG